MEGSSTMDSTQFAFEERATGYMVLRDLVTKKPNRETLQHCVAENVFKVFPYIETNDEIAKLCDKMHAFCTDFNDVELEQLAKEYSYMFEINTKQNVYPYESPHKSADKLMMQKCVLSFRAFLDRYSLESGNKKEPDDSLANELDFLVQTSIKAIDANVDEALYILKDQKSFYEMHLNTWIKSFTDLLFEKSSNEYYKKLSKLLELFIAEDYKQVQNALA